MSTISTLQTAEKSPSTAEVVPIEVLDAYGVLPESVLPLNGGIVNLTFQANTPESKLVLQRLDSNIPAESFEDFDEFTQHLKKEGWETPEIYPSNNGQGYFFDLDNNLWRSMTFIESDEGQPRIRSDNSLRSIGRLLAKWHISMSHLDYLPQYQIPHFHDTDYQIGRLIDIQDELPGRESKDLADKIALEYESLEDLPDDTNQLIHGDPKIANILFRDGQPFTLIDLDTVMRGSTWLDIGDALRSIIKVELCNSDEAQNAIRQTATAYHEIVAPEDSQAEFQDKARIATKRISLELASRYLIDVVEANYFTWDKAQFPDRASNHTHRAIAQWQMYKKL